MVRHPDRNDYYKRRHLLTVPRNRDMALRAWEEHGKAPVSVCRLTSENKEKTEPATLPFFACCRMGVGEDITLETYWGERISEKNKL